MAAMTTLAPLETPLDPRRLPADVEIVVPVYNEAAHLSERVLALRTFLDESFPFRALVTVVDNASTDDTFAVAAALEDSTPGVAAMHLPRKGRGYALRTAWSTSRAPVVAYMDVDLSTSLPALLPLVAPLLSGHSDVAIGSRLAKGRTSFVDPSASSSHVRTTCCSGSRCAGASATPSAASRRCAAMRPSNCCRSSRTTSGSSTPSCSSPPSDWACASARCPSTGSTTQIRACTSSRPRPTTCVGCGGCCGGVPRGMRPAATGQVAADQLMRFAGVGVISTLGYLFLFLAWRPLLGAFGANTLALAITTLFNTAVHRELSRGTKGQPRRGRFLAVSAGLYLVSLAFTTLGLLLAKWIAPGALLPELLALTVATLVASVFRFSVLRAWIFRPSFASPGTPEVGR